MDQLPDASTFAVGTYPRPVSPKNVVAAGRESLPCVEAEVDCVAELGGVCALETATPGNVTRHAVNDERRATVVESITKE